MRNGVFALGLSALMLVGCGAESGQGDSIDELSNELVATTQGNINCGGPAVGGTLINGNMTLKFAADQGFTGGRAIEHPEVPIDISKVASYYPPALFQTGHVGASGFTYTFGPFPANQKSEVRLLFAETYFKNSGKRQFNVSINATAVLSGFDILQAAGAKGVAIEKKFTTTADANGFIKLQFSPVPGKDQPLVSGIIVNPIIPPTMP